MASEITPEQIVEAATGPQSVTAPDGRSATARSMADIAAAEDILQRKKLKNRGGWNSAVRSRVVPPGMIGPGSDD